MSDTESTKKMTYMDVVETCNLNVQFDELHTHKQEKIQRHIQLPKLNWTVA
jgi:hypothetical protein